ncbi:DUF488 domain-containing protein [Cohnella zeiphila]|uniref:DUF488 domain-containing protein n=1 Tax=Cohnella zeiphila TaxID=2761120 RepID=A0A7X0VWG7_9BACL|nr:DUF488 domain-containing protein [Cohnella zeiphila]MBB6732936.1 DUF488 domain-containing protein [Cohnella zeiphila]
MGAASESAKDRQGGIRVKRVFEQAEDSDGARILVDRLWPRGVAKESARLAIWMKEVAPSPSLRAWFGHVPERFAEFKEKYEAELSDPAVQPALERLCELARSEKNGLTLLYAARDPDCNHAVVLQQYLERMRGSRD